MVFSVIISGHWLGLRRRKSALGDGQGGWGFRGTCVLNEVPAGCPPACLVTALLPAWGLIPHAALRRS